MGPLRWIVLRSLAFLAMIYFSLGLSLKSWADCPEDLSRLAASAEPRPPIAFSKWSFKEQNIKVTAEQLFPPDYIKEIEEKVGPIQMRVYYLSGKDTMVKIQGVVRNQSYFTVSLIGNPDYPKKLLIDQLRLENPADSGEGPKLHYDQRAKGLPPAVFRYVQKKIFELAKAGDYEEVFTNSQQHFAAAMLYRKIVGMEPVPGISETLFSEIEKLYAFARRELPQELRPTDVKDFTEWLGTVSAKPSGYTLERAKKLEHYLKTGELDPSIQIFKDKEGRPICALFTKDEKAKGRMLFIYHHFGVPQILYWTDISASKRLALAKKL